MTAPRPASTPADPPRGRGPAWGGPALGLLTLAIGSSPIAWRVMRACSTTQSQNCVTSGRNLPIGEMIIQ